MFLNNKLLSKCKRIHAAALGPVRSGQDIKNELYSAARKIGPSWNLWPGRATQDGYWMDDPRSSGARNVKDPKCATCQLAA